MGFINWLRKLFHRKPKILSEEEQIYLHYPQLKPEPARGIIKASEVLKVRKMIEIQKANQNRRKTFCYGEHFKRRQPTTARQLWKPNAKLEEDN